MAGRNSSTTPLVTIEKDGSEIRKNIKTINFEGAVDSVTDDGNRKVTVTIGDTADFDFAIQLAKNGNGTNFWLSFAEQGVPTNQVPWTPLVDCQVVGVSFSNRNSGTGGNPLEAEIRAYYKTFGSSGSVGTGDSTGWYVDNTGPGLIQNGGNGRMWLYDNSGEGDTMERANQYAFRVTRLSGSSQFNDVAVTIYLKKSS
jgi:hypothetical protein